MPWKLLEALLDHLVGMGIQAELANRGRAIGVKGQSIDLVHLAASAVGPGGHPLEWRAVFIVCIDHPGVWSAQILDAHTRDVKSRRFWGHVVGIEWVGGELADVLNGDRWLNQVLMEQGQTMVEIGYKGDDVEIVSPPFASKSQITPVAHAFPAYNRIAKHVRLVAAQL